MNNIRNSDDEPHLSMLSTVNDTDDIWDGDTCLGNVGRNDNFADAGRRCIENGTLTFG